MIQGFKFKDWNVETAKGKHSSNTWKHRHIQELYEPDSNSRGNSHMN